MTFPGIFPISHWSTASIVSVSLISSIQTGEITIAANSNSNTATINSVNTTYSCVLFNGWRSSDSNNVGNNNNENYPMLDLTNGTTVTAQTSGTNTGFSRIVGYTVVEWNPTYITSIQQGQITISGANTSATATISSVNTSNAFVCFLGENYTATGSNNDYNYCEARIDLTNSTTVTATKDNSNNPSLIVNFVVIEFTSGVLQSVQPVSGTIAGSNTTANVTITAVNDTNSMLMYNGWNASTFATSDPSRMPYMARNSTTNVTVVRGGTSLVTVQFKCTIVEFASGFIASRQAAITNIAASSASSNATISTIDTTKSILLWGGGNVSANEIDGGARTTAKINTSTQVTVARATATARTTNTAREVMEFA